MKLSFKALRREGPADNDQDHALNGEWNAAIDACEAALAAEPPWEAIAHNYAAELAALARQAQPDRSGVCQLCNGAGNIMGSPCLCTKYGAARQAHPEMPTCESFVNYPERCGKPKPCAEHT
jgi:hypothetical protein